jgi:hypothetical protein
MNTSSVIFVGGFTIVFGFFAAQSFDADARALMTADTRASQLQADLIASTGVNLAAYYMASPSSSDGTSVTNRAVNGGTLTYTITWPYLGNAARAMVVSVGTIGGVSVTKRGLLAQGVSSSLSGGTWSQWTVLSIFTDPYSLSDVVIE